jgi:hypothetical protein
MSCLCRLEVNGSDGEVNDRLGRSGDGGGQKGLTGEDLPSHRESAVAWQKRASGVTVRTATVAFAIEGLLPPDL